jgi:hypothetical protein
MSIVIWSEGNVQIRSASALDIDINLFVYIWNKDLLLSIREEYKQRTVSQLYDSVVSNAVKWYNINEARCRKELPNGKVIAAFLAVIDSQLDLKNIHDSTERMEAGHHLFETLLKMERLHSSFIHHANEYQNYINWIEHGFPDELKPYEDAEKYLSDQK